MSNEATKGLSEVEVLAIYAPLAKAGKSWDEIMQHFPQYKKETLAVRISGIRRARKEKLLSAVEAQRKSGAVITSAQYDALEEKLVNDVVPNVKSRGRTPKVDTFSNEFADALSALASLSGGESESDKQAD
jgi:GTPase Era involved in 16S rRNA processing